MMTSVYSLAPNLAVGAVVRVADRTVSGHCRTPRYLRGKEGQIVGIVGPMRDPVRLAYHRPGLPPRMLYRVRFRQDSVWPDYAGSPGDTLEADIYDDWLEDARDA